MGVAAGGAAAHRGGEVPGHREPGNGPSSCADHEFHAGRMGTPHGNGVWMDKGPPPPSTGRTLLSPSSITRSTPGSAPKMSSQCPLLSIPYYYHDHCPVPLVSCYHDCQRFLTEMFSERLLCTGQPEDLSKAHSWVNVSPHKGSQSPHPQHFGM